MLNFFSWLPITLKIHIPHHGWQGLLWSGPCLLPQPHFSFFFFLSGHTGPSVGPRMGQPHSCLRIFALAISSSRNYLPPALHRIPSHLHWDVASSKKPSLTTLWNLAPPHHSILLSYLTFPYCTYNYLKLYPLLISSFSLWVPRGEGLPLSCLLIYPKQLAGAQ